MGRHLPTRTRRPWLLSFSLTTIVVAPPLRTTRRECGRGRSATRGDSSSSSPPGPGSRRLENRLTLSSIQCSPFLVRSLFIQCSLLTLRFFGWRTTDSFPMSFPLVRIIRSSHTPCFWYLHNSEFLHYVYNYNTLWGWWGSGRGKPRTNGREGNYCVNNSLFYFCVYFEGLGFSRRTLGRYAWGARPISYVPMEIFLFYKMWKK
jgi:hypothetical protein